MKKCIVVNLRKKDFYDVYIGRGSIWGNPYEIGRDGSRDEVCNKYEEYFWNSRLPYEISRLCGCRLGCFCKPARCHGDFLARLANEYSEKGYIVSPDGIAYM